MRTFPMNPPIAAPTATLPALTFAAPRLVDMNVVTASLLGDAPYRPSSSS
jgi:hypothetical protein